MFSKQVDSSNSVEAEPFMLNLKGSAVINFYYLLALIKVISELYL